ncbi:hypothetical protein A7982_13148 [Minicystis rosea]|nr:hypothetical protein A7982_13148 [Minicystis rosea]
MRFEPIVVVSFLSISSALCVASCVPGSTAVQEAQSSPRADDEVREPADESDDRKSSEAGELDDAYEGDGGFTYRLCSLLKGSSTVVRAAFCLSQPACDVRGRCFSHLGDSAVSWGNWCYNEFVE